MTKRTIVLNICIFLCFGWVTASNYPTQTLKKGDMEIMLFLPDCSDSYYRASRFDWGSMLGQITYKNHTFLQQWENYNGRGPYGIHNPLTPNTGTGLAEEFSAALGYEEAGINDCFVKIGVGVLLKEENTDYAFAKPYKIVSQGVRNIRKTKNSVVLTHELDSKIGYGYKLERTYKIKENKLIVEHRLRNTGSKRIVSETYSHNFMQFDFENFGSDYALQFLNSDIDASKHKWTTGDRAKIEKNSVGLKIDIKDFIPCFGMVDVLSQQGNFRLINKKTGMSVEVCFDKKVSSFVIWTWQKAFCAEPKILIDIQPGEMFEWDYIYSFNIGKDF